MQSHLSSCPGVCQARHRQRGPNICLLNIYSVASSAPTTAPATGNNPEPSGQSTGRQIILQYLAPAHIFSLLSHFQPSRNIFLQFFPPSRALLIWRCWKILFFLFLRDLPVPAQSVPPQMFSSSTLLLRLCFTFVMLYFLGKMLDFRSARLNAIKMPIFSF